MSKLSATETITNTEAKILQSGDLRGELVCNHFLLVACAYSECRMRTRAAGGGQRNYQNLGHFMKLEGHQTQGQFSHQDNLSALKFEGRS